MFNRSYLIILLVLSVLPTAYTFHNFSMIGGAGVGVCHNYVALWMPLGPQSGRRLAADNQLLHTYQHYK
jgi:hypothetical protein